jgi:FtsH-binding integral membrane protein
MQSSDLTLGKIIRRFFLYVGIALAVLAVFAALIVFTKGGVGHISGGWFGLLGYTGLLFWVTIRQTREHWLRLGYWLAIGGLLLVHSLAFVAIRKRTAGSYFLVALTFAHLAR